MRKEIFDKLLIILGCTTLFGAPPTSYVVLDRTTYETREIENPRLDDLGRVYEFVEHNYYPYQELCHVATATEGINRIPQSGDKIRVFVNENRFRKTRVTIEANLDPSDPDDDWDEIPYELMAGGTMRLSRYSCERILNR